jgi:antitoxin component of RelBE/YafQ-DinJ toxin-antitoxin module
MKEKKVFIQIQCPVEVREMAYKIAEYRGVSISDVVREYLKNSYKALPGEAK